MAEEVKNGLSRRTVLQGAAWSVPIVAVAATAPMASASINNAAVYWDGTRRNLLTIDLLDGTVATANVGLLPSVPNNIVLDNGPGDIAGPITGVIDITWQSGIPAGLSLGGDATARGFAVTDIPGATLGTRTITQRHLVNLVIIPGVLTVAVGCDETSQPFTLNTATIAGGAEEVLGQVVYGLTNRNLLGLSVLMTFTATVSLYADGELIDSASDVIQVPAGAGVL